MDKIALDHITCDGKLLMFMSEPEFYTTGTWRNPGKITVRVRAKDKGKHEYIIEWDLYPKYLAALAIISRTSLADKGISFSWMDAPNARAIDKAKKCLNNFHNVCNWSCPSSVTQVMTLAEGERMKQALGKVSQEWE